MHFDSLQYVRINKISQLCRLEVKIKKFNFKLYNFKVYNRKCFVLSSYAILYNYTINIVSHVTIRLAVGHLLWVFQCDHASILHRYGDIVPQSWTMADGRTHGRSGDFILCPMLCIALDRQQRYFRGFFRVFCFCFLSSLNANVLKSENFLAQKYRIVSRKYTGSVKGNEAGTYDQACR